MGLAVDSLLEERNPISDETKKAVYQVFNSVKIVTKKRINKYKVTEDLRRHLNKKVRGYFYSFKLTRLYQKLLHDLNIPNEFQLKTYDF